MLTTLGDAPPPILGRRRLEFGNVEQITALRNLPQPQEPNEEGQKLYKVIMKVTGTIQKMVWADDEAAATNEAYEEAEMEVDLDDSDIEVESVKEALQ